MTLCNMAIEAGGHLRCVCMPDAVTVDYLWKFIGPDGEKQYMTKEEALKDYRKWNSDADAEYDAVHKIDVATLVPVATFGFKPDQVKTIRELAGTKDRSGVYRKLHERSHRRPPFRRRAVLKGKTVASGVRGVVSPATPAVFQQALSEGIIQIFMDAGFCVTNPTLRRVPRHE